jgi:hypothetical protein
MTIFNTPGSGCTCYSRNFIPIKDTETEILEFSSIPGETCDFLPDHILEAAQKHDNADNVIGISVHNTSELSSIRDRWKEICAHFKKEHITYEEME